MLTGADPVTWNECRVPNQVINVVSRSLGGNCSFSAISCPQSCPQIAVAGLTFRRPKGLEANRFSRTVVHDYGSYRTASDASNVGGAMGNRRAKGANSIPRLGIEKPR